MVKKVVGVVGFGNIGLRHYQSLVSSNVNADVFVVDPRFECQTDLNFYINSNVQRTPMSPLPTLLGSLHATDRPFDLIVLSTNSDIRYDLFCQAVQLGCPSILLEKIVTNNPAELEEIAAVDLERGGVYVNLFMRHLEIYRTLVRHLRKDRQVSMEVDGNWGLMCNSIHFIDLFANLFCRRPLIPHVEPCGSIDWYQSKRLGFLEADGMARYCTVAGDTLTLSSHRGSNGLIVNVSSDELRATVNPIRGLLTIEGGNSERFNIPLQSERTTLRDLLFGKMDNLVRFSTIVDCHQIFTNFSNSIYRDSFNLDNFAPIT